MDLSLSHKLFKNIRNNRWQNDFTEQEKIGKGGFASVYRAKNCFDDQFYAIKKIKLSVKDIKKNFEQEIQRVLDEAKFLAQVNHPNVLRYYNSWLEAKTRPRRVCPFLKSKPSLFKKMINGRGEKPRPSLSSHEDEESEEEKQTEEDGDSPAIIFERSMGESEHGSDSWSRDNSIGEFQKVPEKKKKGIINQIYDNKENVQTPIKGIKMNFNFENLSQECNTPLLGEESLETVTLCIQTELCAETLEDYLQKRNETLERYRKKSSVEYWRAKKQFMKEALVFANQILRGISHIHRHNIVHRDLKPSNIFIGEKNCKIGDFGLIKRLHSICVEASPVLVQDCDKSSFNEAISDDFKLESPESFEFEMVEELPKLSFQKVTSEPLWQEQKHGIEVDLENFMTRSVGTKIYASPEQWQADQKKFDQRADIFSLGIIFLLLFRPMGTYMEQADTIKESKEGRIPADLENELPEIAKIIKKMMLINPAERPSLDTISQSLKLPHDISTDLAGQLYTKRENSGAWRKKHFKLIGRKLYIFNRGEDKKAEVIYDLSEWKVEMKHVEAFLSENGMKNKRSKKSGAKEEGLEVENKERSSSDIITIENTLQLGCSFRGENTGETLELFQKLNRSVQSF